MMIRRSFCLCLLFFFFCGIAGACEVTLTAAEISANRSRAIEFFGSGTATTQFGYVVSGSVGDLNGDGFGDFAISASLEGNNYPGVVYVVFGRTPAEWASATFNFTEEDTPDPKSWIRVSGGESNMKLGMNGIAPGDFNGDGLGDLLISSFAKKAFVVFGQDTNDWSSFDTTAIESGVVPGFSIHGGVTAVTDVRYVGNAGDMDGDNIDDMLFIDTDKPSTAFVVFGKPGSERASFNVSTINGTNGFSITDITDTLGVAQESFGPVGDVNGDGLSDLGIGSYQAGANYNGRAYIIFARDVQGSKQPWPASINLANYLDGIDGFTIEGSPSDYFGYTVRGAGDVNADGFADVFFGPYSSQGAWILFGHGTPWSPVINAAQISGATGFHFVNSNEEWGCSGGAAGDVNGDGFDDIIIGGRSAMVNNILTGAAAILFGHNGSWPEELSRAEVAGSVGFIIEGKGPQSSFGTSAWGVGDVNGDSLSDVVIGAPDFEPGKGHAVLVFGVANDHCAVCSNFTATCLVCDDGFHLNGTICELGEDPPTPIPPIPSEPSSSSSSSAFSLKSDSLGHLLSSSSSSAQQTISSTDTNNRSGEEQQTPSSSTTPPGGGGGHALAIALGVSIPLLALIAGAIVLAVCIASRRRGRDGTSSSKRESAAGAVEMGSASGKAVVAVVCTPETLDFTHNGKDLCRVGEVATFPFAVTNPSGKRVTIEFKPEQSHKWEIAFDPPTLTLEPHEENAPATCQLKLLCTTVMSGIGVPMVVQGNEIGQLWVSAEGALSSMLDRDEIALERALGSGSFATVHAGKWRGTSVAVKVFREHLFEITELAADVRREVDLCMNLRHPNIIQYFGAAISKTSAVIVMELATNGSLGDAIKEHKLTVAAKFRMAHDVASGMLFLHTSHVIHRDLKPDNVLLMSLDPNAPVCGKLSDFGTSRTIGSTDAARTYTKGVGTPVFCAPEVLDGHRYSSAADVYSFSMLLWNLFSEITPFSEVESIFAMVKMIGEGKRPGMLDVIPEEIRPMIEGTWQTSAEERAKFDTIVPELERIMAANGTLPAHMAPHRL